MKPFAHFPYEISMVWESPGLQLRGFDLKVRFDGSIARLLDAGGWLGLSAGGWLMLR